MSKNTQAFFEQLKSGAEPGLLKSLAPGLSLGQILGDLGDELRHQGAQGAHELAAALFRGHDAFVMYPKAGQDRVEQGQNPVKDESQQHQDQDGREM